MGSRPSTSFAAASRPKSWSNWAATSPSAPPMNRLKNGWKPIGTSDSFGHSVVVQTDGKILVAGETYNGSNWDFALVRYTDNGSLDYSFGGGTGKVTTAIGTRDDDGYSVVVQSDGK